MPTTSNPSTPGWESRPDARTCVSALPGRYARGISAVTTLPLVDQRMACPSLVPSAWSTKSAEKLSAGPGPSAFHSVNASVPEWNPTSRLNPSPSNARWDRSTTSTETETTSGPGSNHARTTSISGAPRAVQTPAALSGWTSLVPSVISGACCVPASTRGASRRVAARRRQERMGSLVARHGLDHVGVGRAIDHDLRVHGAGRVVGRAGVAGEEGDGLRPVVVRVVVGRRQRLAHEVPVLGAAPLDAHARDERAALRAGGRDGGEVVGVHLIVEPDAKVRLVATDHGEPPVDAVDPLLAHGIAALLQGRGGRAREDVIAGADLDVPDGGDGRAHGLGALAVEAIDDVAHEVDVLAGRGAVAGVGKGVAWRHRARLRGRRAGRDALVEVGEAGRVGEGRLRGRAPQREEEGAGHESDDESGLHRFTIRLGTAGTPPGGRAVGVDNSYRRASQLFSSIGAPRRAPSRGPPRAGSDPIQGPPRLSPGPGNARAWPSSARWTPRTPRARSTRSTRASRRSAARWATSSPSPGSTRTSRARTSRSTRSSTSPRGPSRGAS